VLGTLACVFLLVASVAITQAATSLTFRDIELAFLFIAPFEAAGLLLLLPIALVIGDTPLPRTAAIAIVTAVGSLIGVALALPIGERGLSLDFALPAVCGGVSAIIWMATNRVSPRTAS
jgi:hypothetical protein